jgi:LPXTG-site transpeptidase (sortase) family protein
VEATRSVVVAALVGAVTLGVAACTTADHLVDPVAPSGSTTPTPTSTPNGPTAPIASGAPSLSTPARPSPPTGGVPPPNQVPTRTAQRAPLSSGGFTLVVTMRSGTITTDVAPISVASHEPVDPPHDTAEQWNTAAWVEQSTNPSTPGEGTTYVYGHACHHHVCSFTNLKDADVGDQVRVTTAVRASTYTIERIGLSSKSANSLPSWAAESTAPNRIVLVTCAYEQGDTSTDNIVVVARLNR